MSVKDRSTWTWMWSLSTFDSCMQFKDWNWIGGHRGHNPALRPKLKTSSSSEYFLVTEIISIILEPHPETYDLQICTREAFCNLAAMHFAKLDDSPMFRKQVHIWLLHPFLALLDVNGLPLIWRWTLYENLGDDNIDKLLSQGSLIQLKSELN